MNVWVHLIWTTKNREPLITDQLKLTLFTHIRENARKKDIYLDFINGVADHVHALLRLKADQTISKIAQLLKGESSHWVNDQKLSGAYFEWQDEYTALSVSGSLVRTVREYIGKQEEHHRRNTLEDEARTLSEECDGV